MGTDSNSDNYGLGRQLFFGSLASAADSGTSMSGTSVAGAADPTYTPQRVFAARSIRAVPFDAWQREQADQREQYAEAARLSAATANCYANVRPQDLAITPSPATKPPPATAPLPAIMVSAPRARARSQVCGARRRPGARRRVAAARGDPDLGDSEPAELAVGAAR